MCRSGSRFCRRLLDLLLDLFDFVAQSPGCAGPLLGQLDVFAAEFGEGLAKVPGLVQPFPDGRLVGLVGPGRPVHEHFREPGNQYRPGREQPAPSPPMYFQTTEPGRSFPSPRGGGRKVEELRTRAQSDLSLRV